MINSLSRLCSSPAKKKAEQLYKKAQAIFNEELPFIPLAHAYKYIAISPKLKGYRLKPFGSERFYHLFLSKDKK